MTELDLQGLLNPKGIQLAGALSLRKPLSGEDPRRPDTYVQAGVLGGLTPAYGLGGVFLEGQPVPWFALHGEATQYRHFGHFGSLLSFPTSGSPYGDAEVEARKGQEEATWARRLMVQGGPQLQIGWFVARHQATLAWYRFRGQGPWFFEYENDVLLKDGDRLRDHQTFVLGELKSTWARVYAGFVHQTTAAHAAGLHRRRTGLVLAFEGLRDRGRLGRPRGGLVVGRILEDRNRQGGWYLQASLGTGWVD